MPSRERVPTEEYQVGERVRALILKVDNDAAGPQIVLTRSHPDFVRHLSKETELAPEMVAGVKRMLGKR